MTARVRLLPIVLDLSGEALGDYAPVEKTLNGALEDMLRETADEVTPGLCERRRGDMPLELKATFSRLAPDTDEHPFASVQVVIEVYRRATRELLYTRKVESEVRRLIQHPSPIDDVGFKRTALGRATLSCMRALFSALSESFGDV